MDAFEFIKEYRRMCNKYYCGKECPLYEEPCDTSSSIYCDLVGVGGT